jgi:D-arabinose 1-dehydrogenase-like Zn-dependent alcohol dehydrogenase
MSFPAYGVAASGLENIKELHVKQRDLHDEEVLLKVMYSGVCSSDIKQLTGGWSGLGLNIVDGNETLVCGHEAISVVIGKGKKVSDAFKIGDIVGCGPQRNCLCHVKKVDPVCSSCEIFEEEVCLNGVEKLYSREYTGSFGQILQCNEKFCFKIPKGMNLLPTAALCCAGLSTYSPLERACKTLPQNATIAVIGIGGLGLMTLQYALKMDPIKSVYAFTTSKSSKETTLVELGCAGVIDYKNEDMSQWKNKFDMVFSTVSQDIDMNAFLSCVKPFGELCMLGVGENNLQINPFALIGNKRVSSSFIGGTKSFANMLEFSHKHNIYPICESVKVPFCQDNGDVVKEAIKRVQAGEVRYRMVLDYCVDVEQTVKEALEAQNND